MSSPTDAAQFTVRRANWADDSAALRSLRTRVFVEEQSVPDDLEWDAADADALHLLALDSVSNPIGTGRLLANGQIGRMAVLSAWRQRGVGSALLREILAIALAQGHQAPFLNAQTSALPFYRRMGFVPIGEEFLEADIPHRKMTLGKAPATLAPDPGEGILGKTAGPVALPTMEAIRTAGIRMAGQARDRLCLFSRNLDPDLYDNRAFLEQVRQVALHGRDIPVRILLFDAEPAIRKGHRLIELSRHMTSKVQIRRVSNEYRRHTDAYLLADGLGYVLRHQADIFEGTTDFDAPKEVRLLNERFDHIWALGDVHQELRRLYL